MRPKKYSRSRTQLLHAAGLVGCAAAACLLTEARFNGIALPLGTALAAALEPLCGLAVLAGSIFTYALTGMLSAAPAPVCAMALTVLLRWFSGERCTPRIAAMIAGGCSLAATAVFGLGGLIRRTGWLTGLAGAAAAAGAAYCAAAAAALFAEGLPLRLSGRDAVPAAVCFVLFTSALCSLKLVMLNFGMLLAGFALLTAARRYRASGGVLCGTLLACAVLICDADSAGLAAVLPPAGLAAGLCSGRRNALSFAVLQGCAALGVLLTGWHAAAAEMTVGLLLGGLIYLLVPAVSLADRLLLFADADTELAALTGARMDFLSQSIAGVRGTSERIANMLARTDMPRSTSVRVREAICSRCRSRSTCWETGLSDTQACFQAMADAELSAPLTPPVNCLKPERITGEFARIKRRNTESRIVSARLHESQAMLFAQMRITEDLIRRAGTQTRRQLHRDLTRTVTAALAKLHIPCRAAAVSSAGGRRLLIELYLPAEPEPDQELLCEVLSDALHKSLTVCGTEHAGDERRLILQTAGGYAVSSAAAQCAVHEDEPCGDCWDSFTDADGSVYLVISDGMGSGRCAAVDSRIVISNFRSLVQSGVDCEAAAKMINAIMLTKSGEERFATLDVAKICTDTAAVTLYKYGAGPTLIRRGDRVTLFQAATNPIGILPKAEPYTTVLKLEDGDMLFLLSDGLDDTLYPYIRERLRAGGDLQALAHAVCAKAQRDARGVPRDDVTVLAAAVEMRN